MIDRTRAERALAFLTAQLRPDWDEAGVLSVLRKLSDRPLPAVTLATLDCAVHRTDQRTPAVIVADGKHWAASERLAGKTEPPTESGIVTWCEHGRPTGHHCHDCQPVTRTLPTEEQRAAMRLAIADAKRELSAARYNDLPLSVGDAQPNRAPEDPTTHTKPAEPKEDA